MNYLKTINILFLIFIIFICITSVSSASAEYTNDIDIKMESINLTISEEYTKNNALGVRKRIDVNNDSYINKSEIESFKDYYLKSQKKEYIKYVKIDNGKISLEINSINMEFENAQGKVSNDTLNVSSNIIFIINQGLSDGRHKIWLQGHPSISTMKVKLPENVEALSIDGLKNLEKSSINNRIFIKGKSTTQRNNLGDTTSFEYATTLEIYKKPFYERTFFITSLFTVLLILIALASYMIKNNKK
ncbi:hypothetical protein [Methanohalobium sp.]|uniref:hypothetical protein n=1 Tax=Methanohalobium sp. TaxID=2837493 RepID=UPI0025D047A8|nr:hypothetical protein [Methanohalobium sp.]